MLKKTVKYTNFNGEERTKDLYFNLTESECAELEASDDNSLSNKIQIIVNSDDRKEIVSTFKAIILKAYGERSADGDTFMKSSEISHKFECSAAFNALFMEISTDADAAVAFINGIMPVVKDTKSKTEAFESVAK